MFGILNINKPPGLTSRDVVNGVQRLARPFKAGHAGTLDPLATGVLVVCLGKATRLIDFVQQQPKHYRADFELGLVSDTEDVEGNVQRVEGAAPLPLAAIRAALPRFVGQISQRPPAYSALKIKGQRAYQLARRGEAVELAPRPVTIYSLHLVQYCYPRLTLDIVCGSGTYVRSLGRDIAESLNSNAVMSALERCAVGPFRIEQSCPLDQLNKDNLSTFLCPPIMAVEHLPRIRLSREERKAIVQGRRIANRGVDLNRQVAAVDRDEQLVAVLVAIDSDFLKPLRVFTS